MLKKNLILTVVISLIIGGVLGYALGMAKIKQIPPKIQEKFVNPVESKVLRDWTATASGKVKEISDRTLTLEANGETLKIPIEEGAKIIKAKVITIPSDGIPIIFETPPPEPEKIDFKDIKVGDEVVIVIILIDNELKGMNISVMFK